MAPEQALTRSARRHDFRVELRPVTLAQARAFVAAHHRHNEPPRGWLFGVGCYQDGELVGVGIASRPVGRGMADGRTVEVIRCCTLGHVGSLNVASRIYGALCRAAQALGYRRAITYTLASEAGSSVRAAGFRPDGEVRAGRRWDRSEGQPRALDRLRLWDDAKMPSEAKVRWLRDL